MTGAKLTKSASQGSRGEMPFEDVIRGFNKHYTASVLATRCLVSLVFSARKKFLVLGIYVLHVWLKAQVICCVHLVVKIALPTQHRPCQTCGGNSSLCQRPTHCEHCVHWEKKSFTPCPTTTSCLTNLVCLVSPQHAPQPQDNHRDRVTVPSKY